VVSGPGDDTSGPRRVIIATAIIVALLVIVVALAIVSGAGSTQAPT